VKQEETCPVDPSAVPWPWPGPQLALWFSTEHRRLPVHPGAPRLQSPTPHREPARLREQSWWALCTALLSTWARIHAGGNASSCHDNKTSEFCHIHIPAWFWVGP